MTNANSGTPAERRKSRQRDRIIEEAVALFHQNGGEDGGFENTTVEEIAARADISVRTFFRYFESKQDVIFLDYRRAIEDLKHYVARRVAQEAPEVAAFMGSLDQVGEFTSSKLNRERLVRAFRSPHFVDRRAVWQQHGRRVVAAALLDSLSDRPDPALAANSISTLVRGVVDEGLSRWVNHPDDDPVEYIKQSMAAANAAAERIVGSKSF